MTDIPTRLPGAAARSHSLLTRVLAAPNLPEQIRALPAAVFAKLVGRVGLEDSGELVALATAEQLVELLDEEIWRSSRIGRNEVFDPARFRVWLSVLLEGGERLAADKLVDLPEDLLQLGFQRQMLVLRTESLLELGDEEGAALEKKLSGCLIEELGGYLLVARVDEGWDDVFAAILALGRDHHDRVVRVLEGCCRASGEELEEKGGFEQALGAAQTLADDVAGERDDRRAEAGYIAPADAAAFLALARQPGEPPERDALTNAYFRRRTPPAAAPADRPILIRPGTGGSETDLLDLLREAELLESSDAPPPLQIAGPDGETEPEEMLLITAMRRLAEGESARFSICTEEVAYLANVVAVGCSLEGRRLRESEASAAVMATCSLGLDGAGAKSGDVVGTAAEVLSRLGADAVFRLAWGCLAAEVQQVAAEVAVHLLDAVAATESGAEAESLCAARNDLRQAAAAGTPWAALDAVESLLGYVDDDLIATLCGLLDQCPRLVARLAGSAPPRFISSRADLEAARAFLRDSAPPDHRPDH